MRFRVFLTPALALAMILSVCLARAQRTAPSSAKRTVAEPKLPAKQQFVLDVVRAAVALPQSDPQDRLRVLNSAAGVIGPIDKRLAKSFAREGARIEAELISAGETPAVSLLASGAVDCPSAVVFVETIPPVAVQRAEQSLLGALSACPKQTLEPIRLKTEMALDQGTLAARLLLALMDRVGPSARWSQGVFAKMFTKLPDASRSKDEAPNYAAMFAQMASGMDKDVVRASGLALLEWLSRVPDSGERNLAVNISTQAMQENLGEENYKKALEANIVAQGVAQTAGRRGEVQHPEEEQVSVLEAMDARDRDRTEVISKLPASLRAREAAAHGFATGTSGDRKMADRYFDIAFSAVEEVWDNRAKLQNAPGVVEEVSEAAAQVDAVAALKRAQRLQDPSAQAISMLAVARVASAQD